MRTSEKSVIFYLLFVSNIRKFEIINMILFILKKLNNNGYSVQSGGSLLHGGHHVYDVH